MCRNPNYCIDLLVDFNEPDEVTKRKDMIFRFTDAELSARSEHPARIDIDVLANGTLLVGDSDGLTAFTRATGREYCVVRNKMIWVLYVDHETIQQHAIS